MLTLRILTSEEVITNQTVRFLLTGGSAIEPKGKVPESDDEMVMKWLNPNIWAIIEEVSSTLPQFKGFDEKLATGLKEFGQFMEADIPINEDMLNVGKASGRRQSSLPAGGGRTTKPDENKEIFDMFSKIILTRIIKPEKVEICLKQFIRKKMGEKFVTPPPFNLEESYAESTI